MTLRRTATMADSTYEILSDPDNFRTLCEGKPIRSRHLQGLLGLELIARCLGRTGVACWFGFWSS